MIYGETLGDVERALLLASRSTRTLAEDGEMRLLAARHGLDKLRECARANQIAALVGSGLRSAGMPLGNEWEQEVEENGERVRSLVSALSSLTARLDRAGIASAAIEAGGIMLATSLSLEGYCPGDIDLLVDESGWPRIPALLAEEGFVPVDRRERPTQRIEFCRPSAGHSKQWLELGCQPFDRMWVPLNVTDRSQEWLKRRIPSRKDPAIKVLEPADALALVTLHTSLHSYIRAPGLRLHVDVDRVVRDTSIDWDHYEEEVRSGGFVRRAFVSLSMARGLLGTPVPHDVLARLYPGHGAWHALEQVLSQEGVFADGRQKLGRISAIRLDRLLDERGTLRWLWDVIAPRAKWMRDHFDKSGRGTPLWRLHGRRIRSLLHRWRPE